MQLVLEKSLEDYLSFADERTRAFMSAPPDMFRLVKDVDGLLRDAWSGSSNSSPIATFLAVNAYYTFMAAVRTAISGHVSCIFPLVRTALEAACYAFLITKDTDLANIWSNREKGPKENAACRKAFQSAIKDTARRLKSYQVEVAEYLQQLYDAAITFGAHPNPLSVFSHVEHGTDAGDGYVRFSLVCMYGESSYEVKRALLACAEYGIVIAYLNVHVFDSHPDPKKFNVRLNEVNELKNSMEERLAHGDE